MKILQRHHYEDLFLTGKTLQAFTRSIHPVMLLQLN